MDLYLKTVRLVKRRTAAQELCEQNLVQLNNHPAKAGKEVKPGDLIVIVLRNRKLHLRVSGIPQGNLKKEDAASFYEVIKEEILPELDLLA